MAKPEDERLRPVADVPKTLATILGMLQAEPLRYRHFGVYWWAVKRMLKQHAYGPEQLYFLGSYTDPEAELRLPSTTDAYLLALAIDEQKHRAQSEWDSPDCYFPDGEPYQLFDADVEQ